MSLTRRDLIDCCLASGALLLVSPGLPGASGALAESHPQLAPTPGDALGPFFKAGAPLVGELAAPGDRGFPLKVSGRVLDTHGQSLSGAVVEVWQANSAGVYDVEGYHYRARRVAGPDGGYAFETVMPGHYPGRVAQHIHYRVSAPGVKTLVTQLYFATDPVFEGDPDKNYSKDRIIESRELIRPVTLASSNDVEFAAVTFETVLVRL